jgi:hypothetical protein
MWLPALVVAAAAWPSRARAGPPPGKEACLDAYERAQRLRRAARLRDARADLIACSNDACPAALRPDCVAWLAEVEAAQPTILLVAKTTGGADVPGVRVSIDGTPQVGRLDGVAVPVDPGPHRVRFEADGFEPVERDIVVREREKARVLAAQLEAAHPPAASGASRRVAVWALGALGVAGLGAFTCFGLRGRSMQADLDSLGCKPSCPEDDVAAMDRSYLAANVSLGVGVASLGVAAYLVLSAPKTPAAAPGPVARTWTFGLAPAAGGLVGAVATGF